MAGRHIEPAEGQHEWDDVSTSSEDEESISMNDEEEDDELSNSRVQDPVEEDLQEELDDDEEEGDDPPKPDVIEINPNKSVPEKDYYFEDDESTIATFDTRHRFHNLTGPDSSEQLRGGMSSLQGAGYAAYSERQTRTIEMAHHDSSNPLSLLKQHQSREMGQGVMESHSYQGEDLQGYGGENNFQDERMAQGNVDTYLSMSSGYNDVDRRPGIGRSRSFSSAYPLRKSQLACSHPGIHRQMMQHPHMETLGETKPQNFQWTQQMEGDLRQPLQSSGVGGLSQSLHGPHSSHQRQGMFSWQDLQHPMDSIGTTGTTSLHRRTVPFDHNGPMVVPQRSMSAMEGRERSRRAPLRSVSATEFGVHRNYHSLVAGEQVEDDAKEDEDEETVLAGRRGWLAREISRRSVYSNSSGGADPPGWDSISDMPGNVGGNDESSSEEESVSDFYDEDIQDEIGPTSNHDGENVDVESDSCSTTEEDDGSIDDIVRKLKLLKRNRLERTPSARFVVSADDITHNSTIPGSSNHSEEKEKSRKKDKKAAKTSKKEKKESEFGDLKLKDKKKKDKISKSSSAEDTEEHAKKKKKESKKTKKSKSFKEEKDDGKKKKRLEGKGHKKEDRKKDKAKEHKKKKKRGNEKTHKSSEHTETTRSTFESDEISSNSKTYIFDEPDVSGLVHKVSVWGDL